MSRPKFPEPYTILTPIIISRINSEQQYYEEKAERYEREQRQREEELEREWEWQEWEWQEYERQK